jgi:pyruvate, orthophosphate dikinase
MYAALERLEKLQGQKLGAGENPLLVSVRSGAKFSMPGMMDTILNLGMNDRPWKRWPSVSGNPRFAYDSYRRLIQMFGDVVLDVPKKKFEHIFDGIKKREKHVKFDYELTPRSCKVRSSPSTRSWCARRPARTSRRIRWCSLCMAREAVFRSWQNDRAKTYRRINKIDDWLGTAVNVQAMVFGNLGENSGTGVGFTRNPATGEHVFFGEYLMNAQGEDVVSGVRTPLRSASWNDDAQGLRPSRAITWKMEKHYRDMQDFEFTIQDGKLYMLQTRNGKRTGLAAVRIAIDMVREGLITQEEASSASSRTSCTTSWFRAWLKRARRLKCSPPACRLRPERL